MFGIIDSIIQVFDLPDNLDFLWECQLYRPTQLNLSFGRFKLVQIERGELQVSEPFHLKLVVDIHHGDFSLGFLNLQSLKLLL